MSYFVTCTFDLKGAVSTDYQNAYAELKSIGLDKVVVGETSQRTVMPTTLTAGSFTGSDARTVSMDIRERVRAAFKARGLSSEIFVTAGEGWAWAAGTTP